eukprot:13467910-Alexandrium_andersonii.AAC.1
MDTVDKQWGHVALLGAAPWNKFVSSFVRWFMLRSASDLARRLSPLACWELETGSSESVNVE